MVSSSLVEHSPVKDTSQAYVFFEKIKRTFFLLDSNILYMKQKILLKNGKDAVLKNQGGFNYEN